MRCSTMLAAAELVERGAVALLDLPDHDLSVDAIGHADHDGRAGGV